jgi:hypothetical protein
LGKRGLFSKVSQHESRADLIFSSRYYEGITLFIFSGRGPEIKINDRKAHFLIRKRQRLTIFMTQSEDLGKMPPGLRSEKMNDNRERRYPMGDKGKKDKDKGQKQKTNRQDQKTKNKLAKQPKRKP